MAKKHNQEVYDFVASHVKGITCEELTRLTNEALGTNFTVTAMHSYKTNHKLTSGIRYNGSDKKKKLFPDEIDKFIRENAPGMYNKDLTELVNKTFGTNYTKNQVDCYKTNHHISSGLTGYFEKGHVPKNKGKKMNPEQYKKCAGTMFKKGNVPHNHRPVGSERVGKDGYIQVKVADPNKWKQKHVVIYEEHYGSISKGNKVIFLDRNIRNFNIENLACVTSAVLVRLNQNHRISECPEVTKTGIALEKYRETIRQKRKENGDKRKN